MRTKASLLYVVLAASACSAGGSPERPAPTSSPAPAPETAAEATSPTVTTSAPAPVHVAAARADSLRESFNDADVAFISGMIHHHAQALVMAGMAESHGASSSIRVLAGRIVNAQNDEIRLMQQWLRERGQPVPDPAHMEHMGHTPAMPGMLTPEQLERLDRARGAEFDRVFLQYMIQHHEGALVMVEELFATYGAAQGDAIFKIASDVAVDQETEIDRMRLMLRDMIFET